MRSKVAEALQGVLSVARRIATSPSAEINTSTRGDVTHVVVVDGETTLMRLTLDARPRTAPERGEQLPMFTETGAPAVSRREVAPPPATPPAAKRRAPVPEADRLAEHGKSSIVGQETDASPWELVSAEERFIETTWLGAIQAYGRVRLYNRGGRCTRDTRDEVKS